MNDHQLMLASALHRGGQAVLCDGEQELRVAAQQAAPWQTPLAEAGDHRGEGAAASEPLIDKTLRMFTEPTLHIDRELLAQHQRELREKKFMKIVSLAPEVL